MANQDSVQAEAPSKSPSERKTFRSKGPQYHRRDDGVRSNQKAPRSSRKRGRNEQAPPPPPPPSDLVQMRKYWDSRSQKGRNNDGSPGKSPPGKPVAHNGTGKVSWERKKKKQKTKICGRWMSCAVLHAKYVPEEFHIPDVRRLFSWLPGFVGCKIIQFPSGNKGALIYFATFGFSEKAMSHMEGYVTDDWTQPLILSHYRSPRGAHDAGNTDLDEIRRKIDKDVKNSKKQQRKRNQKQKRKEKEKRKHDIRSIEKDESRDFVGVMDASKKARIDQVSETAERKESRTRNDSHMLSVDSFGFEHAETQKDQNYNGTCIDLIGDEDAVKITSSLRDQVIYPNARRKTARTVSVDRSLQSEGSNEIDLLDYSTGAEKTVDSDGAAFVVEEGKSQAKMTGNDNEPAKTKEAAKRNQTPPKCTFLEKSEDSEVIDLLDSSTGTEEELSTSGAEYLDMGERAWAKTSRVQNKQKESKERTKNDQSTQEVTLSGKTWDSNVIELLDNSSGTEGKVSNSGAVSVVEEEKAQAKPCGDANAPTEARDGVELSQHFLKFTLLEKLEIVNFFHEARKNKQILHHKTATMLWVQQRFRRQTFSLKSLSAILRNEKKLRRDQNEIKLKDAASRKAHHHLTVTDKLEIIDYFHAAERNKRVKYAKAVTMNWARQKFNQPSFTHKDLYDCLKREQELRDQRDSGREGDCSSGDAMGFKQIDGARRAAFCHSIEIINFEETSGKDHSQHVKNIESEVEILSPEPESRIGVSNPNYFDPDEIECDGDNGSKPDHVDPDEIESVSENERECETGHESKHESSHDETNEVECLGEKKPARIALSSKVDASESKNDRDMGVEYLGEKKNAGSPSSSKGDARKIRHESEREREVEYLGEKKSARDPLSSKIGASESRQEDEQDSKDKRKHGRKGGAECLGDETSAKVPLSSTSDARESGYGSESEVEFLGEKKKSTRIPSSSSIDAATERSTSEPNFVLIDDTEDEDDHEVEKSKFKANPCYSTFRKSRQRKPTKKTIYAHNPQQQTAPRERVFFSFNKPIEETYLEQERLFQQAASRARFVLEQERKAPRVTTSSVMTFFSAVQDVETLPSDHWKWPNLHSRLGLPKAASVSQVRKQYRKLALMYHPDKSNHGDATSRFQAVTDAYHTLTKI